jgi:hypothetical protein
VLLFSTASDRNPLALSPVPFSLSPQSSGIIASRYQCIVRSRAHIPQG